MKFTPHHHTHITPPQHNAQTLAADGHTFSFPDYPTVPLFVFKHEQNKLWYVRELRTGLKAGTDGYGSKTRAAAVAKQYEAFEAMRNCPCGKGRHAYVTDKVEEAVVHWTKNRAGTTA